MINFGDGPQSKGILRITSANADLLRQIAAWWLYGPKAIRRPETLKARFTLLRVLFILCSNEGITASDLMRFPAVADKLPTQLAKSTANNALMELHILYEQREQLGFTLLDLEGLSRLEAALPEYKGRQTPYIPPRIWSYQVNRLRAFLDDFHAHREGIEACYRFCLDAYSKNYGSLSEACRGKKISSRTPFTGQISANGTLTGAEYTGPFSQTAQRFGIDGLLNRWTLKRGVPLGTTVSGIRSLSMYFSMVSYVGMAYLLNFSLMRIEEGSSLRTDCLEIEKDERFGPIYILHGETSKTTDDDDARWPTSSSAKVAVDAMACIARLRMICADANPDVPTSAEDISNPHLFVRSYEPWISTKADDQPLSVRLSLWSYGQVIKNYPKLFDPNELQITKADLQIARIGQS